MVVLYLLGGEVKNVGQSPRSCIHSLNSSLFTQFNFDEYNIKNQYLIEKCHLSLKGSLFRIIYFTVQAY